LKNGKKPSWTQRKVIEYYGLDAHDWLVSKDTPTEMVLVHRYLDGVVRALPK
jgi:hypothetical protein